MKLTRAGLILLAGVLVFSACAGQKKIVIRPEEEPPHGEQAEQPDQFTSAEIIESQNAALPEWVSRFIRGGIPEVETMGAFRNRYVFIGKNRSANFNALRQWAENFNEVRDFPRLAAARIEHRLLAAASLYPDDEYGEYFEVLIKSASDAEYPGAIREDTFWIKQRTEAGEAYEFLVLISIDKIMLRFRIRGLMADARAAVRPARAQNAAINRIQQNFFEDF